MGWAESSSGGMAREGSSILLAVFVTDEGARVVFDGRVEELFGAVPECMYAALEDDLSCWFAALEDVLSNGWSLPPPVLDPIDRRVLGSTPWLDGLVAARGLRGSRIGHVEIYLLRHAPYAWALWQEQRRARADEDKVEPLRTSMWCWTSLDAMKASAPRRGIDGERRLRWISAFHRHAASASFACGSTTSSEAKSALGLAGRKGWCDDAEFAASGPAGMVLADLSVPRPS